MIKHLKAQIWPLHFILSLGIFFFLATAFSAVGLSPHPDDSSSMSRADKRNELIVLIQSISSLPGNSIPKMLGYISSHDYQIVIKEDYQLMDMLTQQLERRLGENEDIFQVEALVQFEVYLTQLTKQFRYVELNDGMLKFIDNLKKIHGKLLIGVAKKNQIVTRQYIESILNESSGSFIENLTGHFVQFQSGYLLGDGALKALLITGVVHDLDSLLSADASQLVGQDFSLPYYYHVAREYILGQTNLMTGSQANKMMRYMYFPDRFLLLEELFRTEQIFNFSDKEIENLLENLDISKVTYPYNPGTKFDFEKSMDEFKIVFLAKLRPLNKKLRQSPQVRDLLIGKAKEWFHLSRASIKLQSFLSADPLPPRTYARSEFPKTFETINQPIKSLNTKQSDQLIYKNDQKSETPKQILYQNSSQSVQKLTSISKDREISIFSSGKVLTQNLDGSNLSTYEDVISVTEKAAFIVLSFKDRQLWFTRSMFLYEQTTQEPITGGRQIWKYDPIYHHGYQECHQLFE